MSESIEKHCNIHGVTLFALYNSGRTRCRKCVVENVHKRRKQLKVKSVEYKGGKCEKCGYSKCVEALDFIHVDASTKKFQIGKSGITRSWDKIKLELDKCKMLCSNCSREQRWAI